MTPLARAYGAALVVGCIDEDKEQAQAVTRERKLAIAQRSWKLLTEQYGIRPGDIIFDPLVFPCATGDQNYLGSAVETIEGIRLIKEALPDAKTILGISNVSFGLPEAGRGAELRLPLPLHEGGAGPGHRQQRETRTLRVDPGRRAEAGRRSAVESRSDPIAAFAAHFRGAKSRKKKDVSTLPLDERLANYIVEGTKDGLVADLELKRNEAPPLEIINGPLMRGMEEVGRLFNANELIVAEVLQSAEAMKAAVTHLEQYMEKAESSTRGKVLLATVKGDGHDIGKNLVDIILSNNGYRVINLGIKIPPEVLIEAAHEHKPDAIGLSGLLVKSAQQMVITAGDLRNAGIDKPLLVGGAALSDRFTRGKIAPAYDATVVYCNDAMNGLATLNKLMDPDARAQLEADLLEKAPGERLRTPQGDLPPETDQRSARIRLDVPVLPVPDLDRHVETVADLDEIWSYINPQMLYGRHLGFPRPLQRGARSRRREGERAGAQRREGEGGSAPEDDGERRLAVLRGGARREQAAHLRGGRGRGHRNVRVPAPAQARRRRAQ